MTEYTIKVTEEELSVLQTAVDVYYSLNDDSIVDELIDATKPIWSCPDPTAAASAKVDINNILDVTIALATLKIKVDSLLM